MSQAEFHIPRFIPQWVESSLERRQNILAESNQGTVLHFREQGVEFLVKTAMGTGAVRAAREATLQREYSAYQRMHGLVGVPRCHGLVDDRYLVLEYIRGDHYREAEFEDREAWFASLLKVIRGFHARGVAHGDLKSKSNLLVTRSQQPCVIDFGTTVLHKKGLHPLNNALFEYLKRLDINAWVKHKYHGRYEDASPEDAKLLDYSRFEALLRRYRKWKKRHP
jgi:RIO-like serine/threonine protein kinase